MNQENSETILTTRNRGLTFFWKKIQFQMGKKKTWKRIQRFGSGVSDATRNALGYFKLWHICSRRGWRRRRRGVYGINKGQWRRRTHACHDVTTRSNSLRFRVPFRRAATRSRATGACAHRARALIFHLQSDRFFFAPISRSLPRFIFLPILIVLSLGLTCASGIEISDDATSKICLRNGSDF